MKALISISLLCLVCAAVVACAFPLASWQLGQLFEPETTECASTLPTNFVLLPEGHRCELQRSDDGFGVSLKSSIPCGCQMAIWNGNLDLKCIAGGPAQITLTSKERTNTVFVGAGEIAFLRADNNGHACRTARWRNFSDLLTRVEWPKPQPATK
jgi:hypothetical protein